MSYRTRITYTRPNTSVDWYELDTDFNSYLQSQYIDTGKISNKTVTESADGLTKTTIREWDSEASLEQSQKLDNTKDANTTEDMNLSGDVPK